MTEPATDNERPQTSTRDPEELRRRLEAWLVGQHGPGTDPAVTGLRTPERNGMSSETVLFDLEVAEAGRRIDDAVCGPPGPRELGGPRLPHL